MKLLVRLVLVAAGALGAGLILSACGAADMGTMTVSPATVVVKAPTGLTFTYTAPASASSGLVQVVVPNGWSPPTHVSATTKGWVNATPMTCTSASVSGITGSGPYTVTIAVVCPANGQFTLTYGGKGGAAVRSPTAAASFTFATSAEFGSATTFTALASSPVVTTTTDVGSVAVALSPTTLTADNQSSTVEVTQTALDGTPLRGQLPKLAGTDGVTFGPVTDNGDGTYSAIASATSATQPGPATITASDVGVSASAVLTDDPVTTLTFPDPIGPAAAGSTVGITVAAADHGGQAVVGAASNLVLTPSGATAPTGWTDEGDGTYTASVRASTTPGTDQVTVQIGSVTATTSFQVVPGPATSSFGIVDDQLLPANGTDQATLTIELRDQYDNLTTAPNVTVTSSGDVGLSPVTLGPDVRYRATVTASTTVGAQSLTLTAGSLTNTATITLVDPVPSSLAVTFVPAAISPDGSSTTVAHVHVVDAEGFGLVQQPVSITDNVSLPVGAVTGDNTGNYTATLGPTTTPSLATVTAADGAATGTATLPVVSPTLAWNPAGSMTTARTNHTATLLTDGDVLVAGGYSAPVGDSANQNGALALASAELYHPATNTWSSAGSMATARADQTATLLTNGKVLVAGGYGVAGALSSTELYDPTSNTWSAGPSMAHARWGHTATRLTDGRVFVFGGSTTNSFLNAIAAPELYDPVSNSWSAAATNVTANNFQSATLLPNGQVLLAGGSNTNSPWLYEPASNSWFKSFGTGSPPQPSLPSLPSSVLLDNGRVLIAGQSLATIDNPVPGLAMQWSKAASPLQYSFDGTLTKLADGRVLSITGHGMTGSPPTTTTNATTEVYDPVTGTWAPDASLITARANHTATLLPDGSVLVVGGSGASGTALASAERSSPAGAPRLSITASPSQALLPANGTATTTVTFHVADGQGAPLAGQALNPTLSGPGTLGPLTDHGDGSYTATYTSGTVDGPAAITVTDGAVSRQVGLYGLPGAPASILVNPNPPTVHVSGTTRPTVDLGIGVYDAFGNSTEAGTLTITATGGATISGTYEVVEGLYDATYQPSALIGDQTVTITATYGGVHVSTTVVIHQVA